MMKKTILLLFLILPLVISACAPSATPTPPTSSAVISRGVTAQGYLEPAFSLDLSFTRSGRVADVLVSEGQSVEAGDVLARLADTPSLDAALAAAQSEFENAQMALKNLEDSQAVKLAQAELLVTQGLQAVEQAQNALDTLDDQTDPDPLEVEQAQAELNLAQATLKLNQDNLAALKVEDPALQPARIRLVAAQAALDSAQAARRESELTAPAAGVVVNLNLKAGQTISSTMPALTLADFSTWLVKTDDLTELEVVKVSVGQAVTLRFDALPELSLRGEVTEIKAKSEIKRGDVTYTVTIRLDEGDPALRWGMTAAVQFEE